MNFSRLPVLDHAAEEVACAHCGQEHKRVSLPVGFESRCVRCEQSLNQRARRVNSATLAWSLAGLVAIWPALFSPLLVTARVGLRFEGSVWETVASYLQSGNDLVAALVTFAALAAPVLFFSGAVWVLLPVWRGNSMAQRNVLRATLHAGRWAMLEVFLLAVLVCVVKLGGLARLHGGSGVVFEEIVVVAGIVVRRRLSMENPEDQRTARRGRGGKTVGCRVCAAQVTIPSGLEAGWCPACAAVIVAEPRLNFPRVWALWWAGAILLVPANLLPVMATRSLNGVREDTIFSGIVALCRSGDWAVGVLVFGASIAVPVLKLSGLATILWSARRSRSESSRFRLTKLYGALEAIGRWSMLDVFLVGFLAAVVRFGFVGSISPEAGVLAFAGAVVLTMLATEAIDPRSLWQNLKMRNN